MNRLILAASFSFAALSAAAPANAFCGFYVAKADAKLFNKSSKVVVARKGDITAVTMASDYQGDLKEFALVVPVPTLIKQDQISIADNATVDHLDAYSAPRLVEYFDPDPCARNHFYGLDNTNSSTRFALSGSAAAPAKQAASALGVKVEAEYTVGEYDIAILSAKESDGLTTYLNQEGYKIPEGAAPVLASYIKQDMKFFVARVNLKEQAKSGAQYLRPIQVRYATPKFMLPIRLGTVNANGPQDMIVLMLTEKGRVETTNYRTAKIPSNVEIPIFAKTEFGPFYKAMFETQVQKDGQKAVYLEYAWEIQSNVGKCDPCTTPLIAEDKLISLGAFWLDTARMSAAWPLGQRLPNQIAGSSFVTRLHVRYDARTFPEDLMFQETADRTPFQGRYILRHPFLGEAKCDAGRDYARSLDIRFAQEAATLATLTGWDMGEIRRKMTASGQANR